MKRQMTKFETTPEIKDLLMIVSSLKEARTLVMKPVGFFVKRYDSNAVVEVTIALSKAQRNLWNTIARTYPSTEQGKWDCDLCFITKI